MGVLFLSLIANALIVLVSLFFLFKKRGTGKSPFRNPFYWLTAIIAVPVFSVALIFIMFYFSSTFENQVFDKANWLENTEERYLYVDDLIENEKLIGISRKELMERLGEADQANDTAMVYYIGYSPKTFMNMDPDWLVADLQDGKVSRVYVLD